MVGDVLRFKENKIVTHLLECGKQRLRVDMNSIAVEDFSAEDRAQFAQLIGYSLSGAGDLSYMPSRIIETAMEIHERGVTPEMARMKQLESQLEAIKEGLKEPIAALYDMHPADLRGADE
jgi:hypothetical protein